MKKQNFINLSVTDFKKSMNFDTSIASTNKPQFKGETATCIVVGDEISLMLLTHTNFDEFTKKEIEDTKTAASVFNALSFDGSCEINELLKKALYAGDRESNDSNDDGLQQNSFKDLSGYLRKLL